LLITANFMSLIWQCNHQGTVIAGVQPYALHLDKPAPEKPTHCWAPRLSLDSTNSLLPIYLPWQRTGTRRMACCTSGRATTRSTAAICMTCWISAKS